MAWTDDLLEASLDGVPFLFESVETEIGRRTEVHEFAGRDEPFAEDLGRGAERYSIRAFVIGENYASVRDALMDVIRSGGDHDFQHPFHGIFTVKVEGKVKVTETDQEGRMARFDMTLVESGLAFPLVTRDSAAKINFISADATEKLSTKTKFKTLKAIGAVLKSIAAGLQKASSSIRKVNGKISAALNLVDNITASINEFEEELESLLGTPQALMNKLTALVTAAVNLVQEFVLDKIPRIEIDVAEPDFPKIVLDVLLGELGNFESEASVIPTPTEQAAIEVEAHLQLSNTVKASTLIACTNNLAMLELDSADSAQAISQALVEKFEHILLQDLDPEVIESLSALKAAAVEHFTETAAQLPNLTTYTPPYTAPALLIAYELYGDASRDADIIKRNKIRHPVFVAGGIELEVLTDG